MLEASCIPCSARYCRMSWRTPQYTVPWPLAIWEITAVPCSDRSIAKDDFTEKGELKIAAAFLGSRGAWTWSATQSIMNFAKRGLRHMPRKDDRHRKPSLQVRVALSGDPGSERWNPPASQITAHPHAGACELQVLRGVPAVYLYGMDENPENRPGIGRNRAHASVHCTLCASEDCVHLLEDISKGLGAVPVRTGKNLPSSIYV